MTGRYCESRTGSFTVSHIAYGYIREVGATFERYCSGSTLPVRGELHVHIKPTRIGPRNVGRMVRTLSPSGWRTTR
ncbi:hypothetical protein ACWC9U_37255 [Streptomyces sp. 900116325]